MSSDWETRAASKRKTILDGIPQKWHLSKIPSKEEQKDVTGAYIHQFLDQKEIEITETDVVGIAEKVAAGQWTAVAVTEAFCHRAALAHQLVGLRAFMMFHLLTVIAVLPPRGLLRGCHYGR